MGAYAAIRLAGLAGAHCALAMSPQFSILPHAARFEYRWQHAARRLRPVWEHSLELPELPEAYLFYDPLHIDAQHAALFAAAGFRFTPVRLRGAGHQVAGFLLEAGMLQDVVLATCRGPLDAPALEREAWQRRRRTPQHRLALAARARNPAWRLALVRRAADLAPGNAPLIGRLALELGRAGRFAEAMEAHREALALMPGHPPLLAEYSATLEASGDFAGALAALEQFAERTGEPPPALWLRRLRARLGAASGPAPDRCDVLHGIRRWLWQQRRRIAGCDPDAAGACGAAVVTASGQRGYALFGPYLELRQGRYEVEFTVSLRPGPDSGAAVDAGGGPLLRLLRRRTACFLDVSIHGGRTVLARRKLTVADLAAGRDGRFPLRFAMPEQTACEFRLFTTGVAGLVIQPARPWRPMGGPGKAARPPCQPRP